MSRYSPYLAFFVMAFTLILISCDRGSSWVGKSAPDVTFKTLTGQTLELQAMDKPVLVNFWSTSCGICIQEMPDLAALYKEYAPKGFELVAVAMPSDRPDQVLNMVEDKALPYRVAIDIEGNVVSAFDPVRATPTTYLISADGKVLDRHVGQVDIKALRATLDKLLG